MRCLPARLICCSSFGSGVALFCVGTASAFGWLLAYYQIPKALLAGVAAWDMGPIATGFFISAVFLGGASDRV
ncbi:MAG: hypothetical protein O2979_11280 [Proteobacteria bacterium]|nr:hypothetical protein [Pseudomonadota bacterium]